MGGRNEVTVYCLLCARTIHDCVCLCRPEMLQLLRRLQMTPIITSSNLHKSILQAHYWFAWPEGIKAQVAFFLLNLLNSCLIATILFLVTIMPSEAYTEFSLSGRCTPISFYVHGVGKPASCGTHARAH